MVPRLRVVMCKKIWGRHIQLICPLEIKSQMTIEALNKRIRVANNEDILTERKQKNERATKKDRETALQKIREIAENYA